MKKKVVVRNKKYILTEDGDGYEKIEITKNELVEARNKAFNLLKTDPLCMVWRSCWLCNSEHYYFLKMFKDKFIIECIQCGRHFYDGIDITDYNLIEKGDNR
jgi:hypothetical protein